MKRPLIIEDILYFLIFLLALFLRFINLGSSPLSDSEALQALQALDLSHGNLVQIGSQPFYVLWTSAFFHLFESSNFLARFWPAIVGSCLVWAIYLFRARLGKRVGLILALAAALDPGWLAVSRQASGLALALVFGVLAVGFYLNRSLVRAAIFTALTLLSGPGLWPGLITLGLALAWDFGIQRSNREISIVERFITQEENQTWDWKKFLTWLAIAFVTFGSMIWLVPGGLGAAFSSLPDYLTGFTRGGGDSILKITMALLVYEIFPLIFALVAIGRAMAGKDPLDRFFSIWLFLAVILLLINPSRQANGWIWGLIPLWVLAARQLERNMIIPAEDYSGFAGFLVIAISLALFATLNIVAYVNNPTVMAVPGESLKYALAILGSLIILLLLAILVGWGWSINIPVMGLKTTAILLLGLYTLGQAWHAAELGERPWSELWRSGTYAYSHDSLLRASGDVSEWATGVRNGSDIALLNLSSLSLKWIYRDNPDMQSVDVLPIDSNYSMIISSDQVSALSSAGSYSGQAFVWDVAPNWDLLSGQEWLDWILLRNVPLEKSRLILWTRSDLFPGAVKAVNP